jgi:dihydroorotate dehydrogenase (NAD+) catalytic subunit
MTSPGPLGVSVGSLAFRNPIVLPSGTAGYGHELEGVIDLDRLGGFVTKAVSMLPRAGAPSPRVAEFAGGMMNAVGLANPGVDDVCSEHLPWLATHHAGTRRFANIIGFTVDEFPEIIQRLETALTSRLTGALDGFELNVSCPNTKAGGTEFGADPQSLAAVVSAARRVTKRPIFVKLSPTLSDIGGAARICADAGADGITVVNTIPGLMIDLETRRPALGFGSGGISGPAILPVGVLATWKVKNAVTLPIIGVGGVGSASDALQYIVAGASLVGVGTAAMRDPRIPERIVSDLATWCARHGVTSIADVRGTLEWPGVK